MVQGKPFSSKKSKARQPGNPYVKGLVDSAFQLHKQGNLTQAELLYRQVLQHEPGNPFSLYGLGAIAMLRGEMEKAIPFLKQSVANGYHAENTYTHLGIALQATGRMEEAKEVYRMGMKVDPKNPRFPSNLAVVLSLEGDLEGAMKETKRALKLDSKFAPAYLNGAAFLQSMERIPEALQMLEKAVVLDPDNAQAQDTLGELRRLMMVK